MQDKLLIKYIKKKNPKGMDMLIDNYGGIIASVVRKHLGTLINYEEECINDVLLSIWESINGYDKDKNTFKNWICAIAKYKSINYRKKYLAKYEQTEINNEIYYIDKNFPLHPTLLPQNNLPESDQRILCTSIHKIHMDTKMAEAMPHNYCTLPFVCT